MNNKNNLSKKDTQKVAKSEIETAVLTTEELAGTLDFDERMWLLWDKNKSNITLCLVAVFIGFIAIGIFDMMRKNEIEMTQKAYLTAVKNGTLAMFTIDHPQSPLSGLTWLNEADTFYKEGNFEKAAVSYQKASENLKDNPLGLRARIGYGMTLYKQGNLPSARNAITTVATSEKASQTARAEAHYLLAEFALTLNEWDNASKHLNAIAGLAYAGTWIMRSEMLKMNVPELNRAEVRTETKIN